MSLLAVAGANSASGGYDVDNSVKLEADDNEWFYNASPTAGNRQTYTISFWIKRSGLGTVNASGTQYVIGQGQHGRMYFTSDYFSYRFDDGHDCRNISRRFRDPNAWYHFVVAVDTTIASPSSNRVKFYVNGETLAIDDHDGGSYPDQNDQGEFLSTDYLTIGTAPFGGSYNAGDGDYDMRGYLAEFCVVDGQQLAPTDFGETDSDTGIWKPIDVSGINFGSQGYYLKFDNSSSLGADSSGNGNNFSLSNIAAINQSSDTCTNNFCTLNPLVNTSNRPTITDGNMRVVGASNWNNAYGSMGVQNGKWYYEYKVDNGDIGGTGWSTFPDTADASNSTQFLYDQSAVIQGSPTNYYQRINGTQISNENAGWGTTSLNDIIGCFLNADDQEITFARNGTVLSNTLSAPVSLNAAFAGHFIFPCNVQYENDGGLYNFGAFTRITNTRNYSDANGYGAFVYEPKIGSTNYYALCTKNLAEFG